MTNILLQCMYILAKGRGIK